MALYMDEYAQLCDRIREMAAAGQFRAQQGGVQLTLVVSGLTTEEVEGLQHTDLGGEVTTEVTPSTTQPLASVTWRGEVGGVPVVASAYRPATDADLATHTDALRKRLAQFGRRLDANAAQNAGVRP